MSEAAQIYVRYDGLLGKGLIANYYGWLYGERLVSRARYGIEWITQYLAEGSFYYHKFNVIKLSKVLDINFNMKDVAISQDIIEERREWYLSHEFNKSVFREQQNNDGKLFIDICKGCVKYAFTDQKADTEHIMDAESYMVWNVGADWRNNPYIKKYLVVACEDNIKYLSEHAQLMTKEELEDFIGCDYVESMSEIGINESPLKILCRKVERLLFLAPEEDECTETEKKIYSELATLKSLLNDAGY